MGVFRARLMLQKYVRHREAIGTGGNEHSFQERPERRQWASLSRTCRRCAGRGGLVRDYYRTHRM